MRDPDIRQALNVTILAAFHADPGSRVVEEMVLCRGKSRIDLAVINGEFCGFEIKSMRDTLDRLPAQVAIYSAIFDRVTLVLNQRHLCAAKALIPEWWGIQLALPGETISFESLREAGYNLGVAGSEIVQLLWRDEALQLLAERGEDRCVRAKAKKYVWRRLAEIMPVDELRSSVREAMKLRQDWRLDPASPRNDG